MSSFGREFQHKLAEFSRLGSHRNPPLPFLNDPVANAQAKSHALTDILRREERIKNFVEVLGLDAGSIVAHNQHTGAIPDAALDPDGWFRVAGRPATQRIERVLQ